MANTREKDQFNVIYGLIYPAILGTGLLGLFSQVPSFWQTDLNFIVDENLSRDRFAMLCFGFVLGVIYVGSFARSLRVPVTDASGQTSYAAYTGGLFWIDVAECVLMALAFSCVSALSFFSSPPESTDVAVVRPDLLFKLRWAHGFLAASLVLSWLWRDLRDQRPEWQAADKDDHHAATRFGLRVVALLGCLGFIFQWPGLIRSAPYAVPLLILLAACIYYGLSRRG